MPADADAPVRIHIAPASPEGVLRVMQTASVRELDAAVLAVEHDDAATVGAMTLDAVFLLNCLGIGGSERKIVRLVNRLWARGVRAGIAYLNGPATLMSLLHADVPRWHLERKGKFSLSAVRRLAQLLDATRCGTLFTVNMYPTLYASAARTLLGSRGPKLIALVNTTDFGAGQRWRQALYKRVLERFDHSIFGCEIQRRAWLDETEAAWQRSAVIYNGVDLQEFSGNVATPAVDALRDELGWPRDAFVVGGVGRLVPAKNHAVLIDAVAAVRRRGIDCRLLVVGDGELRSSLERRAAGLEAEQAAAFTGALTDLRPAFALMDVFVLPSLFIETFSNAALEAMAMRKAVILSDVGGAPEMVRDGVDGRVLARQSLATELPKVLMELAQERSRTRVLGAAARHRVEAQFSLDSMVSHYERLIERQVDGHPRA